MWVITQFGYRDFTEFGYSDFPDRIVEVTSLFSRAERQRRAKFYNGSPMFRIEEFELNGESVSYETRGMG